MSILKLIGTNLVTALLAVIVTSFYWIGATSHDGGAGTTATPRPGQTAVTTDLPRPLPPPAEAEPGKEPGAPHHVRRSKLVIGPTGLVLPVLGIQARELTDTYTQARAGGRRHDAIDIMADSGTPVVAAAPGRVEKLFFSKGGGGITAYIRSPDGRWIYYYAHLRNYAPELREGLAVRQGDVIGNVGSTGNASPEGPHLHFAIHKMERGQRWWQGTAINPYPLLAGSKADR